MHPANHAFCTFIISPSVMSLARFRFLTMPSLMIVRPIRYMSAAADKIGLSVMDRASYLHRAIKPAHNLLRSDGSPLLIDIRAHGHSSSPPPPGSRRIGCNAR